MFLKIVLVVLFWGGIFLVIHVNPLLGGWLLVVVLAYQIGKRLGKLIRR